MIPNTVYEGFVCEHKHACEFSSRFFVPKTTAKSDNVLQEKWLNYGTVMSIFMQTPTVKPCKHQQ